ncbi:MAG: molybdopterin molybdotransferase MoeA [Gammaproteobacteria bacterium]|nr:molybdopterin molybdotransferase MoeA [Gammaproteobacteria bacterium]
MPELRIKAEPGCMDDFDPKSLPVDAALERILSAVQPETEFENVPVRAALNRVLHADVVSGINVPGGTNSAMDGYAVASADLPASGVRELEVIGTAWAGRPFPDRLGAGQAVRIMTGGILPAGADTVIIQELAQRSGDRIRIGSETRPGDNVRAAGEDIAIGARVLAAGTRLTPADIGLLASLGIGSVAVRRRIRVAFFSTGDELRSIGEPLGPGDVYDSNRYTLHGMLSRLGAEITDMGVVGDRRPELEAAFVKAAATADVVITSGGVSVGEADFVKEILEKTGQVEFWKVAMKPGRPLAFGRVGDAWFFGLPGNPVSVMVTFYQFVQPALRRLMGENTPAPHRFQVRCESRLKKRPGRVEFQRGVLAADASGRLVVRKTGAQGSGILSSMANANCFIILPMDSTGVEAGAVVEVEPFFGLV